jgi:hypothetical protein
MRTRSHRTTGPTGPSPTSLIFTENGSFTVPEGVEKIFVTLIGGGGGYSLSVEPGEVEVVEVEEERLSLTSQFRQHLVKH